MLVSAFFFMFSQYKLQIELLVDVKPGLYQENSKAKIFKKKHHYIFFKSVSAALRYFNAWSVQTYHFYTHSRIIRLKKLTEVPATCAQSLY